LPERTKVSVRFKMTVVSLTALMFVFFFANICLAMFVREPTPTQNSLIDNTSRAWQALLALIGGFFGGKYL
jgi:hypothetical protein